jgi:tellurite resistance protein TerC
MGVDWVVLFSIVAVCLILDLGVFHKNSHEVGFREASMWTIFWILLSLIFAAGIWYYHSTEQAILFLTGYVVEKSLSVDNLFLFIVIFNYFSVKPKYQHRVLFWGVLGAIITRGALIYAGVILLERFQWLTYVFGGLILITGIRTLSGLKDDIDLESNVILKVVRRFVRTKVDYEGQAFFIIEKGLLYATPLFVVLLVMELTDVLFALDSIPAILGITADPFLVYSSNLFAILGLRSLYFVLSGLMSLFEYLSVGVSFILIFVGVKMLSEDFYHISPFVSLAIISLILFSSILPSIPKVLRSRGQEDKAE